MSETVSGALALSKLRNGSTAGVSLSVDKDLSQLVSLNASGGLDKVAPDWTVPANQPTITALTTEGVTLADMEWLWNGSLIIFPSDMFVKTGNSLKIVKNIGSADNLFTDTISMRAMKVDSAGQSAGKIELSVDVPIQKASSSGYTVLIDATRTTLTADNPTATLSAKVLQGATELTSFARFLWYKGMSSTPVSSTPSKTLAITREDVNGSQLFVARAMSDGNVELDAKAINIYDMADNYDISYTCSHGTDSLDNVKNSYQVPAAATSTVVTPHVSANGTELTGKTWRLQKMHADSVKLISEVDGVTEYTTDTEAEGSYNTVSGSNITVHDKDYVSIASGKRQAVEVIVMASVDI